MLQTLACRSYVWHLPLAHHRRSCDRSEDCPHDRWWNKCSGHQASIEVRYQLCCHGLNGVNQFHQHWCRRFGYYHRAIKTQQVFCHLLTMLAHCYSPFGLTAQCDDLLLAHEHRSQVCDPQKKHTPPSCHLATMMGRWLALSCSSHCECFAHLHQKSLSDNAYLP